MRVTAFRRAGAFLFDAVPVLGVLSLLFTLFAGELLKPADFEENWTAYRETVAEFNEEIEPYYNQYNDGDLSEEDYRVILTDLQDQYFDNEETNVQIYTYMTYVGNIILFYFIGFMVLYYIYNLVTKTRTFGRRILKIELTGKITWWSILLREVVWKVGFWGLTLFGGILLDMILIGVSKKKQTLRDMVSNIRVTYEGIEYPF